MCKYNINMILPSGYLSTINEKCTLCSQCMKTYQFETIELKENGGKKDYMVNPDKCFGCRICEVVCGYNTIDIKLDPKKWIPLNRRIGPRNQ